MAYIAHLRTQIKSINTFSRSYNIYYLIGPGVQEEKILKFRECTFAILLLAPDVKRFSLAI